MIIKNGMLFDWSFSPFSITTNILQIFFISITINILIARSTCVSNVKNGLIPSPLQYNNL